MAHAAATHVPAETDWLCEGCGYTLNGLPEGGNCPECGKPTRESANDLRDLPLWERPDAGNPLFRFWLTTGQVLFQPTRFYRSFATRGSRADSLHFARIHWLIASILFGVTAWVHLDWFLGLNPSAKIGAFVPWYFAPIFAALAYVFLATITRLAARLTNFEATYRGLRLPLNVVLRGLDYHAAHYLPVSIVTIATVVGYRLAMFHSPMMGRWGTIYLYTLCGEVVLAAGYLFKTYWIGMRNMMYASR